MSNIPYLISLIPVFRGLWYVILSASRKMLITSMKSHQLRISLMDTKNTSHEQGLVSYVNFGS